MGLLNAIDRLANAGAGSRMPPEKYTEAKTRAGTANKVAALSDKAIGKNASRADQRKAHAELVRKVGEQEAKKQMEHAAERAKQRFF